MAELEAILLEDFRIEEEDLCRLDLDLLNKIYNAHAHSAIEHLLNFIKKVKG
jgi:hypothetical protein